MSSIAEFMGVYMPKKHGAVYLVTRLYTLGNAKDLLEFEQRLEFQESKPRLQLMKEKFIQMKFYPLTPLDLVLIAKDAAAGMNYLQSMHIIHRDLACRNLLLEEVEVCIEFSASLLKVTHIHLHLLPIHQHYLFQKNSCQQTHSDTVVVVQNLIS
jgi:serine/threonine protein kinase